MTKNMDLKQLLNELKRLREINPDPVFQKQARIRLLSKISNKPRREYTSFYRFAYLMLLLFLLTGAGIVSAAQSSQPGDSLYQIKIGSEKVVLKLAPTQAIRDIITLEIKERRKNEQEGQKDTKNERGKQKELKEGKAISNPPKAVEKLQKVLEKTPEQAKKGLDKENKKEKQEKETKSSR